ncbi:hypothetical protein DPMN_036277 [Dreissena polymorpha]|uniref:G-protein coupled receptors family 1 profile domain-containing protein n=1 Tax=Dreissena polymorpha TaxID=45954 RepID=A0A9D4M8V6_DREPO|nr:hypothetical protein DPMN_036277 [Dreissena polymorpha]
MENSFASKRNITYNTESVVIVPDLFQEDEFSDVRTLVRAYYLYFFIIESILVIPTVFGNALILLALVKYRALRRVKAFLLVGNLAAADFLVGLVAIPMNLVSMASLRYSHSVQFCFWHVCIMYTSVLASVVNLFLLSLERFDAIVNPFCHHKLFTTRRVYFMMIFAWIVVGIFGFSPFYRNLPTASGDHYECRTKTVFPSGYLTVFNVITLICVLLSTSFFIFLVYIARNSLRKFTKTSRRLYRQKVKRELRRTRNLLIISGIFIVCWAPYCIVSLVPSRDHTVLIAKSWLASLGVVNSSLNWVVFGVKSVSFRSAFKNIVTCACRRNRLQLEHSR